MPTRELASNGTPAQPASDAGWRPSRYNVWARIPDDKQNRIAVANLYRGSFGVYSPLELAGLSMLNKLPATHPAIERLAKRGLIVNFDERAAIESLARASCAHARKVQLVVCPTMGCNFDCPYCFEDHTNVRMSPEVQDDVVALAGRMLEASHSTGLFVTWYGGEPLLALDIVEGLTKRLSNAAKEHGATYEAKIVTNGFLLSPEAVEVLERSQITTAQVTLDGVGAAHDATRYLADGKGTFERIVANLSQPNLPFKVNVRHNVHGENLGEADELRSFVEHLAAKSKNDISFYVALVNNTQTAEQRGKQVDILHGQRASDAMLGDETCPKGVRPMHCGAGNMWEVAVDSEGRIHKCWENVGKPEFSFGNARDWNPANPLETAQKPDLLTCYINSSSPLGDDECAECLWLPVCAGGCPQRRIFGPGRQCVAYKDDPQGYALALWRNQPGS